MVNKLLYQRFRSMYFNNKTGHNTLSNIIEVDVGKEWMSSDPVIVQTILRFSQQWTYQVFCWLWHSTIAARECQTILQTHTQLSDIIRQQVSLAQT